MTASAEPSAGMQGQAALHHHRRLPYLIVVGAVLLVYANALQAGFVADDALYVTYASRIRSLADLLPYFTTSLPLEPVLAPVETRVYRPVFFAYGALAYHLWGPRPWAWHTANVLLHAVAACLVLVALRRLFGLPPAPALLACLFWAVHPVNVEAVTYVMGANYLVPAVSLLLAVLVACGWWPRTWPLAARSLVAACAFAISVLGHELGLMAPALAMWVLAAAPGTGWIWGHRPGRGALAATGAMGAAALAYVALRLTFIGTGQAGHLSEMAGTVWLRLLQAPEILLRYLALLAVPARLTLERSHDLRAPTSVLDPSALLAWGLFALLTWGVARIAGRVPIAAFGGVWFLIAYFPISNTLIPLYSVMAERYLYIPSVGIVAAVTATALASRLHQRAPQTALLAAILLISVYAARSSMRNQDWRDEISFYHATVAASPKAAYMHNNLGNAYRRRGDLELAERAFRAALEADPGYVSAHIRLGNLLLQRGCLDEAEALYQRATLLRPNFAEGYYGLAMVSYRRGQGHEALRLLARASALLPAHIETDFDLGMTYASSDPERAAAHLRRFLTFAPDHPQAAAARARLQSLPPAPAR